MEHLDTRDIAALLEATDDDGHIDPTIYEALCLILHHRRHGWIDTDALMRSVHRAMDTGDTRLAHRCDGRGESIDKMFQAVRGWLPR